MNSLALGDLAKILEPIFKNILGIEHLPWNWSQFNATEPHWWNVNIDLGNGSVPSGGKPLPEPMMTQFFFATWRH